MARKRIMARRVRRRRIVAGIVALLLLGGIAGGIWWFMTDDENDGETAQESVEEVEPEASPTTLGTALAGDPQQLLYQFEESLITSPLPPTEPARAPQGDRIFEVASEPAVPSRTTGWVAYRAEGGQGDVLLRAADLQEEEPEPLRIGPGVDPLFNPSGSAIAYLEPEDPERCDLAGCRGPMSVAVFDIETQESETLTEPGRWSLHTWVGEDVLWLSERGSNAVQRLGLDGSSEELTLDTRQLGWVSPDGRWLMNDQTGKFPEIEFYPLEEGRPSGEPILGPFSRDARILDVAWSHDSQRVAVIAQGLSDRVIVMVEADGFDGEILEGVPEEPTGRLMWAPDNQSLAMSTLNREEQETPFFDFVWCSIEELEATCDSALRWTAAVTPLRLQ